MKIERNENLFTRLKHTEVSKFYYKIFLDIMIHNEISNSSRCTIE